MKYIVLIAACALMSGCGDADEDTGAPIFNMEG